MKTQQFKTNVKCGACVAAITPEMEKIENTTWKVDLAHPDRILTVEGVFSSLDVFTALEKSGYKAEKI
ncbi:heavy metal transport/detoxification protein [Belliella sp. R4-6]|uniref:Heavy metal transport/detoxification protein n=1 Tax=Belliella alkalica TaxID=1730871 RepID=A0ABS9VBR8_9BACT|nr:heavy metal transport/detoxification protein [Belliella alkalica]MCH7413505.1 heavy metal transport/detoxification protein [Belliella alkalica]